MRAWPVYFVGASFLIAAALGASEGSASPACRSFKTAQECMTQQHCVSCHQVTGIPSTKEGNRVFRECVDSLESCAEGASAETPAQRAKQVAAEGTVGNVNTAPVEVSSVAHTRVPLQINCTAAEMQLDAITNQIAEASEHLTSQQRTITELRDQISRAKAQQAAVKEKLVSGRDAYDAAALALRKKLDALKAQVKGCEEQLQKQQQMLASLNGDARAEHAPAGASAVTAP